MSNSSPVTTNGITSRQRVMTAISHREPDRVPIDFWATTEVKRAYKRHLNMTDDEQVLRHLGVDFRVLSGPVYCGPELAANAEGVSKDIWGVERKTVYFGEGDSRGSYQELAGSPFAGIESPKEIEQYGHWPSADWWDCSSIEDDCRRAGDYAVVFVGDRTDRTAQLKPAMYLRGVEEIMLDMALNPEVVDSIVGKVIDYYLEFNRRVFEAANGGIDIFMMGDDFGTQISPMMSGEMWDRFFKNGFRRYIELAHSYGIKVMHHTCGSVRPLIPRFIDAGLDILQSLQPRATGMDLGELKKEFGSDLSFQGSIDIQHTMPNGTPEEINVEVRERMAAGKPGGGFIICTAHNIQMDTPMDNITALFEACHQYSAY